MGLRWWQEGPGGVTVTHFAVSLIRLLEYSRLKLAKALA